MGTFTIVRVALGEMLPHPLVCLPVTSPWPVAVMGRPVPKLCSLGCSLPSPWAFWAAFPLILLIFLCLVSRFLHLSLALSHPVLGIQDLTINQSDWGCCCHASKISCPTSVTTKEQGCKIFLKCMSNHFECVQTVPHARFSLFFSFLRHTNGRNEQHTRRKRWQGLTLVP